MAFNLSFFNLFFFLSHGFTWFHNVKWFNFTWLGVVELRRGVVGAEPFLESTTELVVLRWQIGHGGDINSDDEYWLS